jgi:transposase
MNSKDIQRYVALDIHKEYVMVGAMNAAQEWVIHPRKVEMIRFRNWAANNLHLGDAVVIETTTNVWDIYDIVAPLVTRTVVAHAGAVRQIAEARVKTDTEDLKRLLRLLIADIVPEVWVPPAHVRELRGLIAYRNRLVVNGAAVRNRLHSLVHRHNLQLPKGELTDASWWEGQPLSALEKIQVRQELALLQTIEQNKAELDSELGKMSVGPTWGQDATRLLQLPGLGLVATMTVLSAIGDIHRFAEAKCLVGYAGLGAGVHDSGKEHKDKGITKSGRKELRWAGGRDCRDPDRSGLARRAQFTSLGKTVPRTCQTQGATQSDRSNCPETIGNHLVRTNARRDRPQRQRRRPGLEDALVVMEPGRRSPAGTDPEAICQVQSDAPGRAKRFDRIYAW